MHACCCMWHHCCTVKINRTQKFENARVWNFYPYKHFCACSRWVGEKPWKGNTDFDLLQGACKAKILLSIWSFRNTSMHAWTYVLTHTDKEGERGRCSRWGKEREREREREREKQKEKEADKHTHTHTHTNTHTHTHTSAPVMSS